MAIYRVQRLYSDDNGGSGMGTFGKVALGAAALGGGLMAGKAGMLGTTVQKGIGTSTAWLGNKVGSQAMINSGAKTVGKAAKTDAIKAAGGMEAIKNIKIRPEKVNTVKGIQNTARTAEQDVLNQYKLTQNAFSEDTSAALREAAIYGTIGTGILGAGYLAKRGLLGKTAKKTYKSASEKVKAIWNETKKPEIKVGEAQTQQVTQAVKGKSGRTIETTEKITKELGKPEQVIIETTAKKVKFAPEDWPKVLKVIKEKGMDSSNPAHKLAAAKIAGVKPVSVK